MRSPTGSLRRTSAHLIISGRNGWLQFLKPVWRLFRDPAAFGGGLAEGICKGLSIIPKEQSQLSELASRLSSGDGPGVAQSIDTLLQQPATAAALAPRLLGHLLHVPKELDMVSLGTHCFTSDLLRRWGLRQWSGPFDWLFSSAPMVAHCIDDDFATFLDQSHYRPVPVSERKAGAHANRVNHDYYHQHYLVEHVFNHHDAHLPDDYAHFQRSVARFKNMLAGPSRKLFVLTRWHSDAYVVELQSLREALARRCSNYRLVVFSVCVPQPGTTLPQLTCTLDEPDAVGYIMAPVSRWEPLRFPDLLDEHCMVHALMRHAEVQASPIGSA